MHLINFQIKNPIRLSLTTDTCDKEVYGILVDYFLALSSKKNIRRTTGERDALFEESQIQIGGALPRTGNKAQKTTGETPTPSVV